MKVDNQVPYKILCPREYNFKRENNESYYKKHVKGNNFNYEIHYPNWVTLFHKKVVTAHETIHKNA